MMKKFMSLILIFLITTSYTFTYPSEESEYKSKNADTPPIVIKSVPPTYPVVIIGQTRFRYEGEVVLKFIVTKEGYVKNPRVVKSSLRDVYNESAIEAVKKYQFKPATKNGVPVDCITELTIEFSLHNTDTAFDAHKAIDKGLKYMKVREYDNAIEAFTKVIKIYPRHAPAFSARGSAYMYLGEYKKAVTDFNTAISRSRNGQIVLYYRQRGISYTALKKYKKAIKDFNRVIKIEPDNKVAYFCRGEALRKSGEYGKAIEDYTKVIELDESYIQAYYNRAISYSKLKDMNSMCLDLKRVCEFGDCKGFDSAKKAGKCSND
jgi:TonB family protein